jgi:predicted nucleotidyltransferase
MKLTEQEKQWIRREVAQRLATQPEVRRVVIFGSFGVAEEPHDLDIAVFQDSQERYLPLALKYRKLLRPVADRIALDVLPLRTDAPHGRFEREEIARGEVVYER